MPDRGVLVKIICTVPSRLILKSDFAKELCFARRKMEEMYTWGKSKPHKFELEKLSDGKNYLSQRML